MHYRERISPRSADDDLIDLGALIDLFRRRRRFLATVIAACSFLGFFYAWIWATPVYRATAVVMLESREASVVGLDSVLGRLATGETSIIKTETEVLRGRALIGRVVDGLQLTKDPEFNGRLTPPSALSRLRSGLRHLFRDAPPEMDAAQRLAADRNGAINTLLRQLEIVNVTGSLVFQITASSIAPEKAALFADTIARTYVEDQFRTRSEATQTAAIWLAEQLATLRGELQLAETAIRDFHGTTSLVDATALAALDRQMKDSRIRREQLQAQTVSLETRLAAMSAAPTALARAIASEEAALLQLARAGVSGEAAEAAFERDAEIVVARLEQDLFRGREQIASLTEAEAALASEIARQSQDLIRLEQLTREAEAIRTLYEHFQLRLKETSAQAGLHQPDSRIISEAVIPDGAAAPRKAMILALSAVVGAIIAVILVLLREMRGERFKTARDLADVTQKPILAQLPRIAAGNVREALDWLRVRPASGPAEAIRNLRISLLMSAGTAPRRVIALTSAHSGEGKTTLTAALAQDLTALGHRVLLIDADIRKATLSQSLISHQPFVAGSDQPEGLAAVLRGHLPLEEAVLPIPAIGDVLSGAAAQVATTEYFSKECFADLLARAAALYDYILIDTPPVLAVPDAKLIARHADCSLLVVRWDSTTRDAVIESFQQLQSLGARQVETVLSQIPPEELRHHGYGYGYGARTAYGRAA